MKIMSSHKKEKIYEGYKTGIQSSDDPNPKTKHYFCTRFQYLHKANCENLQKLCSISM